MRRLKGKPESRLSLPDELYWNVACDRVLGLDINLSSNGFAVLDQSGSSWTRRSARSRALLLTVNLPKGIAIDCGVVNVRSLEDTFDKGASKKTKHGQHRLFPF